MTRRGVAVVLVLAVVHAAIILSLGVQASRDSARLPRAWAQVSPFSPSSRVHGRYLTMNLVAVTDPGVAPRLDVINGRTIARPTPIALEARHDRLVAHKTAVSRVELVRSDPREDSPAMLAPRLECFLAEDAGDVMTLIRHGELWVEVSVPAHGPPRPLRLGKMEDAKIVPLTAKPR